MIIRIPTLNRAVGVVVDYNNSKIYLRSLLNNLTDLSPEVIGNMNSGELCAYGSRVRTEARQMVARAKASKLEQKSVTALESVPDGEQLSLF